MNSQRAERFLFEVKKDFVSLDRKNIFNIQTSLLKEMRQSLSNDVFANFISNYKNIATAGQYLFSDGLKASRRLLIEEKTIKLISSEKKTSENDMKHIDNLTYKTFINKFNQSYDKTLRQEQKDLLTNYITSFSDNGLGLKSFLNEEVGRLKQQVQLCLDSNKIKQNESFFENTNKILEKLNLFNKKPITEELVKDIFYIQDLVAEVLE